MRGGRITTMIFVALWLSSIASGLYALNRYQLTPGMAAAPLDRWPSESKLRLSSDRATLIMFAHPHCPCTRASITELETLISRRPGKFSACVVFFSPDQFPPDWAKSELWLKAAAIPGVNVQADECGIEAGRFHSFTSGQTLVYGADGNLLFSGGITDSRGHEGDSAGTEAVLSMLDHSGAQTRTNLVYGCSLVTPHSEKN